MGDLSDEIIKSALVLGYEVNLLTPEQAKKVASKITSKFLNSKSFYCYPFCEFIVDTVGIHDSQSWSWISNYLSDEPVIIFFEPTTDKSMVTIENGLNLSAILGECFGFVYYLTNLNYDYLVCETDHGVLVRTGTAKQWIKSQLQMRKN